MLDKLACAQNRNDEVLNIQLAHELCKSEDKKGIAELVSGLKNKDKRIANDCIKVIYEIGEERPDLIAPYAKVFIRLLTSSNNRLVWGGMTALSQITAIAHSVIYDNIDKVLYALQNGSVITVDNAVSVLAKLCIVNSTYKKHLFPVLLDHLRKCRPKEVAQHAERISIAVGIDNLNEFSKVLDDRIGYLRKSQQTRITRLIKKSEKNSLER